MRLAVSNIAWPSGADDVAASVLAEHGAEGVDIAPTKVWPRPLEATAEELRTYRRIWEDRGLPIVGMQALLFGHPELTLFGPEPARLRTVEYLKRMIDLAADLGVRAMVFGSPNNRLVGDRPREEAEALAVASFRELGGHASAGGVDFCIEANPVAYGCDFVVTTPEAMNLVKAVDREGFGLHIDTGGMTLAGEDPEAILNRDDPRWSHFHISEPHLAPIGRGGTDHRAFAECLRRKKYERWVSVEMKEATPEGSWIEVLRESLRFTRQTYFPQTA